MTSLMHFRVIIPYKNDRNNKKMRHRRIVMSRDMFPHNVLWNPYSAKNSHLLGSSNGLVCIYSHDQVLVANSLTRDVKKLPIPKHIDRFLDWSTCWGFGYDSSTDDYKVVSGSASLGYHWMTFQVLSLKTNVWKDVGKFKYMRVNWLDYGILCNGKLHWFMKDQNEKVIILSFDLFEENLEEISQPREFKFEEICRLGIIEECLCICDLHHPIWVMKNYNVRESWVSLQYTRENDNDAVHCLRPNSLSHVSLFTSDDLIMSEARYFNCDPIYVRSLVSPHVNGN